MTTNEYANSLRLIADWYEQHPDMPVPMGYIGVYSAATDELQAVARALRPCTKEFNHGVFALERAFGAVRLGFVWSRSDVCVATRVGERYIPEQYIPARVEDVVEWTCEPIMGVEADSHETL